MLICGCTDYGGLTTSIDILQLASKLDAQVEAMQRQPLAVMVQVRKLHRNCSIGLLYSLSGVRLCSHS